MKSHLVVTGALSLGLLATMSAPASAHHGNAAYADEITEFKQATVTKFAWANPHTLINFDAKNAKGEVVHMVVETAAPQALRLIGWERTCLARGVDGRTRAAESGGRERGAGVAVLRLFGWPLGKRSHARHRYHRPGR